MESLEKLNFWKNKTVLITGHTGFKGTWLTIWLNKLGAKVIGYSLEEYPNDEFFNSTNIHKKITDCRGNICNFNNLKSVFDKYSPEIVLHLAAQPIVRKSYDEPLETINTNIMGTTNVLECIRLSNSVKASVIISSDKCYENKEWIWEYSESDELGGHDPYSCTKGCIELLVRSYRNSFFKKQSKFVATARAGNVIGGGDMSEDRLIPDCIKSLKTNKKIIIRNPQSTRPWQHVLEPLNGYMLLAEKLFIEEKYDSAWNFGPNIESIKPVKTIAKILIDRWGEGELELQSLKSSKHESKSLSLDISKASFLLNWKPRLNFKETIPLVVEWYKKFDGNNSYELCYKQIEEYEKK